MKIAVFKNDDSIFVFRYVKNSGISFDEALNKTKHKNSKYLIMDDSELPDSEFQNAWVIASDNLTINIDKAKKITKERLRQERKPLLEAQDVLFMQAQESGSDTKAIVAEKQRLRDITKSVDSCKTTDELKALKCEAS
tara:strand:- start:101 stop:514 length:414 start_codon:yes stop_codon:yes gene_type:complete